VVPTDSHKISGVPCYSGTRPGSRHLTSTGVSPSPPRPSSPLRLQQRFLTPRRHGSTDKDAPQQPRAGNTCQLSHPRGLASSAFARHYSRNHTCFLFLWVLRCFTSPRSLHPSYEFRRGRLDTTPARFPHSVTPGSQLGCQLPGAYRRLLRPSSALGAKASTMRP
jgi:hypothetical protein